jgi:hypothetical protein
MNHGLNLGGIEMIRSMEGTKNGATGLVWSSGTGKDFHRAVEREMKTKVWFKLICERHEDMWIDGVQLNVKELLIYLIFFLDWKKRRVQVVVKVLSRWTAQSLVTIVSMLHVDSK